MAESVSDETIRSNTANVAKVECAVCLQTSVHPAELPCGHIFCYLCIKGIVNQGRRCAMCRQDIPVDYLDKPRLLNPVEPEIASQGFDDGHLWFYEGHNGWWQYDERTSLELEYSYQKGERCCDLLIAGFLYVADFDGMLQYRRNDPFRKRRIKRDLATTTKKGIAGLKATKKCNLTSLNSSEVQSNNVIQNLPVSNSSALSNLGGVRIFTSGSNTSSQHSDRILVPQRLQGISSGYSHPNCRPVTPTNSNALSETDTSNAYSTNINLDSAIHDTLDWTIEQIESLNLELLNDYESLFRDVNHYGQLQDNLNQSLLSRRSSNCMSMDIRNPQSDSFENNPYSTNGVLDLSPSNISDISNFSLGVLPDSSGETDPVYSDFTETSSDRSSLQSVVENPQPPPRNRGMSRSRSRGDPLRRSSSLNCGTLLQKYVSNK